MLENALEKLFPSGELEEITRNLLTEELPQSQNDLIQTFIDTNESIFKDAPLESDPMSLDTVFDDDPSLSQVDSIFAPLDSGTERSELPLNSHHKEDSTANNPVASPEQEKTFIDTYFSHYHRLYPYVHEATFKRQLRDQLPTCLLCPVLKSMIMAFGSWLACERGTGLGIRYYKQAQFYFQSIPSTEQSGVSTVQALLLLGDFAQKQGSPEESWDYVAMAVQKALSLNLHVEPTALRLTALEKEVRRRVWWAAYCSESCAAKIYGRPLVLPEEELITVGLVTNTHEPVSYPIHGDVIPNSMKNNRICPPGHPRPLPRLTIPPYIRAWYNSQVTIAWQMTSTAEFCAAQMLRHSLSTSSRNRSKTGTQITHTCTRAWWIKIPPNNGSW